MAFPNQNNIRKFPSLGSQAGQTVVEYILTLVVTVGLILGGVYQLNMAFKVWANNYFGDYLACLLETGELPGVGGTPGAGGGECNTFFKPFSLADGRPLLPPGKQSDSQSGKHDYSPGAGSRDKTSGGGGSNGGSGSRFGNTSNNGNGNGGKFGNSSGSRNIATNTGSTKVSSYGGYSETNRKLDTRTKESVDQRFAFENEKNAADKTKSSGVSKSSPQEGGGLAKVRIRHHEAGKDDGVPEDSPMTFGNFMKWLIIAAIVIALVFFIGGQMLQIGKSMD